MNKSQLEFPVTVYGSITNVTDTVSKARCRIFYKYENRNSTYISDEFAEELLSTISYVPVKGIFEEDDYTDHGTARTQGRIYGIVPENPNLAWEKHLDEDGVEREYACVDVYLFTALYPEASQIIGKAQSMELYAPSLKYHEAVIKGRRYVVFEHGCFLGLQVLGEDVEPCFEGAAFYSLQQSIEESIEKIREISANYELIGGHSEMEIIYKLSDREKFEALWMLLNPNCNEENDYECNYCIVDVYDGYALVRNIADGQFERVYYTKNDADDSVVIDRTETVYFVDITEQEKQTLDTLRRLNGGTYEQVSATLENAEQNLQEVENLNSKIEELDQTISTLHTEEENLQADLSSAAERETSLRGELSTLNDQVSSLQGEIDSLNSYKHDIETQQKSAVIAEYAGKLSEEVLVSYREKLDEYTAESLDMSLAYELKKANPSIFGTSEEQHFVPKDDEPKSGVERILSKYKKK